MNTKADCYYHSTKNVLANVNDDLHFAKFTGQFLVLFVPSFQQYLTQYLSVLQLAFRILPWLSSDLSAASPEFPLLVPTSPIQPLKIGRPKSQVSVFFSFFSHSPVMSSGLPVLNIFFLLVTSKFLSLGYVTFLNSRLQYPNATSSLIDQT